MHRWCTTIALGSDTNPTTRVADPILRGITAVPRFGLELKISLKVEYSLMNFL